jgi:adenylate cyclase, class 2
MPRLATNREIEIKLRIEDLMATVKALRHLGAKCLGRVFESNTLYDTAAGDFQRSGRLLRLRLETSAGSKFLPAGRRKAVVTSKAPVPDSDDRYKEKFERELVVKNSNDWATILRSIGFRAGFHYEKYRTTFRFRSLHVDLDETPVGTFLELEGPPRAIDSAATALGFSRSDYVRSTYWDLFQSDRRRRGHRMTDMRFRTKKVAQ